MNSISKYTFVVMLCISNVLVAQMPIDAIYMPKKTYCIAITGSQSTWNEYWEGSLKRENLNMGRHTTKSVGVMVAAGITDKLNLILNLPYVSTQTSAGNLLGQKGVQDLSGFLKFKLIDIKGFTINGVVGGSIPVGNYVPDFLPMSIGLQSKTATGRVIGNYHHKSGVYLQGHIAYTFRGASKIDGDSYFYNDKLISSNKPVLPNTSDSRASVGYYKNGKQIDFFVEQNLCLTGDNIRRDILPSLTNNTQTTILGVYGKYQPKNFGLNARAGYCINGLNVGKSTAYSIGLLYNLNANKRNIR